MEDLNKNVLDLMNNYSQILSRRNEVYKASFFQLNNQSNKNNELGISILLKEELLNEKDIDLFDIILKYEEKEPINIYIHEVSICTSDGIIYLEFSNMMLLKKDFIRFLRLFLDESIRLYKKKCNFVSYLLVKLRLDKYSTKH